MEWILGLSGLWLIGRKVNDSVVYTKKKIEANKSAKPNFRSHLDGWQRYDFAWDVEYNYMDEYYDKKHLDAMGIAIGDIDTYRGLEYTEEDDEYCNTNATQGIRIIQPPMYEFASKQQ